MLVVTALASGSSGNALLLRYAETALLVDCGLTLRAIEQHLRFVGLSPATLRAILLTHEHRDHALSADKLARRYGLPVVCNSATRAALEHHLGGVTVEELPISQRASIGPFDVTSFLLPHDAAAPVGYCMTVDGVTLGIAVDLGSWTPDLVTRLRAADLLVIEANYDRAWLTATHYPLALRRRIVSPLGHLDNVQTGELLAQIGVDGRARDVWLAHLSERANSPRVALKRVQSMLDQAGVSALRLSVLPRKTILAPGKLTVWHSDARLRQMDLFD